MRDSYRITFNFNVVEKQHLNATDSRRQLTQLHTNLANVVSFQSEPGIFYMSAQLKFQYTRRSCVKEKKMLQDPSTLAFSYPASQTNHRTDSMEKYQ